MKTMVSKLILTVSLLLTRESFAQHFSASCQIDYMKSASGLASLYSGTESKVCSVRVTFTYGTATTERAYSCRVLAEQDSCQVNVSNAPNGWTVKQLAVDPIKTQNDLNHGCVYAGGYPSARIIPPLLPGDKPRNVIIHRYDCPNLF